MGELLLGVDLGTTGTKVTLLSPERGAVASRASSVPLHSDAPGWSEADTDVWWENVCTLIPAVCAEAAVSPREIAGVAVSGMVPAIVLLDRERRVLRRAILQNDARAVDEIREVQRSLDAGGYEMLARTGSALTQQSVGPTWRWLRTHEPDIADATVTVLGSYDWLASALGAPPTVEANWALESGLYELTGEPATAVREAAAMPDHICPEIARPGSRAGTVSAKAASATSLIAGTPIYTGGADHVLAAYAAGLAEPGDWLVKLGGAGDILVVTDHPAIDWRWYLDAHPSPGLWLPNGCMATSGSLLRWVQALVGGVPLAVLDEEAASVAPASLVCLPYFLGEKSPLHDPDLRGAFVGLHLGHQRGDLFRACMEAVAYGFRNHVDAFRERSVGLGRARVSNGGSGSYVWKQILADVLGTELTSITNQGGASLGAALVAAVGAGALPDWKAAGELVDLGGVITPNPANAAAYEDGYALYLELQRTLTPVSHRLAAGGRS